LNFAQSTSSTKKYTHFLRHTNATLLIAGGTDNRTVASNLGHSQPWTSLHIYSHAVQYAKAVAAKRIENFLNPTKAKSSE
jgi:integrase